MFQKLIFFWEKIVFYVCLPFFRRVAATMSSGETSSGETSSGETSLGETTDETTGETTGETGEPS